MADRIELRNLLVRGIIGINDDERVNKQDVIVNLTLFTDTRAAAASDRIEDTVNYRTIAKRVILLVESSSYFLVERLAERIAELCLDDSRVQRVVVRVEKPGAIRFAESVGVVIDRERRDGP